jgi:hypothetical protein
MASKGLHKPRDDYARLYRTGGEALMATELRMPWERKKLWPAGAYTLLADSYTTQDRVTYSKGDTLVLNEVDATRLGNTGAIASPDSMRAVGARAESGQGTKRDEYLYQMWKLAGVWEDPGKP